MIMLGDKAKDPISGFEGVVTGHIRHLHNCDRVYIRPQAMKDGKPIEGEWFDAPPLALIESAIMPAKPPIACPFSLGDVVKDTITGLQGTITGIATYLAGCTRAGIQPAGIKDGKVADETWLPVQQLKLVKAAKKKADPQPPGGPMKAPQALGTPRRIL